MSSPKIPNPADASITGQIADINNYPTNYLINAAAQQGGKITIGGKTYDFTGQGNADISAADTEAQDKAALDIQQKYGADYIQQALDNLKQSNPVGYAARQQLAQNIQQQSQDTSVGATANDEQKQVEDMLAHAGELDPNALKQVQQGVRGQQVARGITLGNAPVSDEANNVVAASDSLRQSQQQAAENYLSSGVSPQDVQYRKIQQSLANLGAFANGQTPEAQFGQLSGAQNGAAPNSAPNYTTPYNLDPNAGAYGINFANNAYNTANTQGNPWLTSLSTAANGASSVYNQLYGQTNYSNNAAAFNAAPSGFGGTVGAGGSSAGVGVGFGGNDGVGIGVG